LIYFGFGVAGAVIGVVLSSVGSCLFLIFVSGKYFEITFSEYIPTTKKILRFGVQMFGAGAVNLITNQTDIIMIGYFMTAADIGYYTVAVSLAGFFLLIPQAIQRITYPATSEYWSNNNHAALQNMIDKSMKYSACILLPLGLGVGFFAKDIVILLFGKDFVYAILPLYVLLIARVIRGGTVLPIGGGFAAVGKPDLILKIETISAATNLILNILFIPVFGILGAAIATTISLLLGCFISLYYIIKILSVKIDSWFYAKISGVGLSAVIFFWMDIKLINLYLLGGAILCSCMVLIFMFILTKEDRDMFKSLIYSLIHWR